jgi:SAM-dependent methyltransferase
MSVTRAREGDVPCVSPSTRSDARDRQRHAAAVIDCYDVSLVRAYCRVRFRIINRQFLDEIGQYLPTHGHVLEVGCGFGLFGLYFARCYPGLSFVGVDLDGERVRMARRAAARLGVTNAVFHQGDARDLGLDQEFDAVYLLDVLHHVPVEEVRGILTHLRDHLGPRGALLIKDVDDRPWLPMAFTWLLDVLMTRGRLPHYWDPSRMVTLLRSLGFQVFCHSVRDVLPYPHRVFFCTRGSLENLNGA